MPKKVQKKSQKYFGMPFQAAFFSAVVVILCFFGCGAEGRYTATTSYSAFQLSKASYCLSGQIRKWDCCSCPENHDLKNITIISDPGHGTQAFIGVHKNRIVAAFRGSENLDNWLTNAHVSRQPLKNSNEKCDGCTVHAGFQNAYLSLNTKFLVTLANLANAFPTYSILLTGHSLGGAMATLAAAEMVSSPYLSNINPHFNLYTFGSPRLGNQAFADWFAKLFCRGGHESYRVVSKHDVITKVPSWDWGFVHVSQEVWHSSYDVTNFKLCDDLKGDTCEDKRVEEDGSCKDSNTPFSVVDHMWYFGKWVLCSCNKRWPNRETCLKQ